MRVQRSPFFLPDRWILLLAMLAGGGAVALAHGPAPTFSSPTAKNLPVLPRNADPVVASFIDPTATISGPNFIAIGQRSFVGPFASLSASKEGTLVIGQGSDMQDNTRVDATAGDIVIGDLVPIAHGATIIGPATIGGFSSEIQLPTENGIAYDAFVSFNAHIEDAIIQPGALVNGLAKVTGGVTIPSGFQVLPGQLVRTAADLKDPTKLAPITAALEAFEVGVFDVNQNFALGYTSLFDISPNSVKGIGFDPGDTVNPNNPGSVVPIIGGVQKAVPTFKGRLDGRLIIANNTVKQLDKIFGDSVAMRGDEGHPISILSFLSVASQSTFHALDNTSVSVGEFAKIGAHCVVHGGVNQVTGNTLTQIGHNFTLGDESVVYRSTIGDNVTIGKKCYIDSTTLPSGTVVPDRTIMLKGVVTGKIVW